MTQNKRQKNMSVSQNYIIYHIEYGDKRSQKDNSLSLLHHPFWLQLILASFDHYFSTFKITLFG